MICKKMDVYFLFWIVNYVGLLKFSIADTSIDEDQIVVDLIERQQEFDVLKSQILQLLQHRENDHNQIQHLTRIMLDVKNTVDELNDVKEKHKEEISELKKTIAVLNDMKINHEKEIKDLKAAVIHIMKGTSQYQETIKELKNKPTNLKSTSKIIDISDNNDDLLDLKEDLENKSEGLDDTNETEKKNMHRISEDSVNMIEWLSKRNIHANGIQKRLDPPQPGLNSLPGFTVCVSASDITLGANQPVVFDRIITNNGGYYHNTGVFTAPLEGAYVFHLSLMTSPEKDIYLRIIRDGVALDDVYVDARDDSSHDSVSETWLLNLQQGSEVWIAAPSTTDVHGNCHTQFTGYLLHSSTTLSTEVLG